MIKRPLGRGLSALISTDPQLVDRDEIREIEIRSDSTWSTATQDIFRRSEAG